MKNWRYNLCCICSHPVVSWLILMLLQYQLITDQLDAAECRYAKGLGSEAEHAPTWHTSPVDSACVQPTPDAKQFKPQDVDSPGATHYKWVLNGLSVDGSHQHACVQELACIETHTVTSQHVPRHLLPCSHETLHLLVVHNHKLMTHR